MSNVAGQQEQQRLPESARKLLDDLLGESREELVRADTKAAMLFGLLGVGLSVVLTGIIAGKWSPTDLSPGVEWLFWVGAATATTSMALLGAAIWPRITHLEDRDEVAYFGHASAFGSREQFRAAVVEQAERGPDGRVVDQVHAVSTIAMRKYRLLQMAILGLAIAPTCCFGAVIIDAIAS